jgi:hypothetical protein
MTGSRHVRGTRDIGTYELYLYLLRRSVAITWHERMATIRGSIAADTAK